MGPSPAAKCPRHLLRRHKRGWTIGPVSRCTFVWAHGLNSSVAHERDLGLSDWSSSSDLARVVRYDARGHGRCLPCQYDDFAYRWPCMVDEMLRAGGNVGPFVAGGTGMGAAVALYTAVRAPRRIQALVLVTPPAGWEDRPPEAERHVDAAHVVEREGVEPYVEWMRLRPLPPVLAELTNGDGRVGDGRVDVVGTAARHLRRMEEKVVPSVLLGAAASDLPTPDEVRHVIVPTLILAWEGDEGRPMSTAEALADLMVMSELHVARNLAEVRAWPQLVRRFLDGLCQWE